MDREPPMTVFVAKLFQGRLVGIFSTREKAREAASQYLVMDCQLNKIPENEILCEHGQVDDLYTTKSLTIQITEWLVDKALISGEWKVI